MNKKIAVTGGAGYVGSKLVPKLLDRGYDVTVLDTFWYGDVFSDVKSDKLHKFIGDIRGYMIKHAFDGCDSIIHLACISNDPSFELNPGLGKSINYDAFSNVLDAAKAQDVERFIYASSSSIYGVKEGIKVTEDVSADPLTDYSKYKLMCEEVLKREGNGIEWTVIRPATVCGYAPRLRLDVVVNILTINALEKGVIKVFGGPQLRPNIHIDDMVDAYVALLEAPREKIHGEAFNAGGENFTVDQLANKINSVVPSRIEHFETNDPRSYHVDSSKIERVLGFRADRSIESAVESIVEAHKNGKIVDGLNNSMYHNIKRMRELNVD